MAAHTSCVCVCVCVCVTSAGFVMCNWKAEGGVAVTQMDMRKLLS